MTWRGEVRCGVARRGVACCGLVRRGVAYGILIEDYFKSPTRYLSCFELTVEGRDFPFLPSAHLQWDGVEAGGV